MRLTYTLLLLSFFTALTAQTYQPILTAERSWYAYFGECDACPNAPLQLSGDTLYQGNTYRTVVRGTDGIDAPGYTIMLLRESADRSRLYAVDFVTGDTTERLVMDLDLTVGDTFVHPYLNSSWFSDPFTVDSVTTVDGRKVITFVEEASNGCNDFYSYSDNGQFINPPDKLRFIEGVGPSHLANLFLCNSAIGDSLLWSATMFGRSYRGDCAPVNCTVSTSSAPALSLTLAPNPARTETVLTLTDATALRIEVHTVEGRLLRRTDSAANTQHMIGLSELPAGLYLLTATAVDGRRHTERLMVR